MLLLADFFGVRDVSWVSHQLIDGSQRLAGCIPQGEWLAIALKRAEAEKFAI